jgi:cytochrome oxidase Cu insertion factor (SCO1/SenC/PrrC family)
VRRLAAALLLAAAALRGAAASEAPSPARLMDDLMWNRGPIGGAFALTDHTGARRTEADFRGRFLLLYFGYTYCPDVCPTDLQAMAEAVERLGDDGARVQPLFITIDPARDTVAHLSDYVPLFHLRLVGLTGTVEEVTRVATAYKAWFRRVDTADATDYLFEHTGFIYLFGPDGAYLGFFPPGTSAERIEAVIRDFL